MDRVLIIYRPSALHRLFFLWFFCTLKKQTVSFRQLKNKVVSLAWTLLFRLWAPADSPAMMLALLLCLLPAAAPQALQTLAGGSWSLTVTCGRDSSAPRCPIAPDLIASRPALFSWDSGRDWSAISRSLPPTTQTQTHKQTQTVVQNNQAAVTESKSMRFYFKGSMKEHWRLQQNSDFELNKKNMKHKKKHSLPKYKTISEHCNTKMVKWLPQ